MWVPGAIKTWVVMLQDSGATVFETANPGGALTRVHRFEALEFTSPGNAESTLAIVVAAWLEEALRDGAFDRLMLVGSAQLLDQLRAAFSPAAEAHLVATRVEDLGAVPPEEMRRHVPEATWI